MITGNAEYGDFFRDSATGCTSHDHISEALIRDFKDEEVVDRELLTVIVLEIIRDSTREDPSSESGGDYQALASHSLGAARRQLCRGNQDVETEADILSTTLTLLNQEKTEPYALLSGRQVYGCLSLLCHYMMLQINRNDREELDELGSLIFSWIPRFSTLDKDDSSPKTIAVRQHALRAWRRVKEGFERRRLRERDEDWETCVAIWEDIWAYIPVTRLDKLPRESPFELLRRCGWSECACSVHAPAHSMRVCKGCWLVAYCGPNCQENDWEKGGHRQRCRRRTAVVLQ
ncbi:zinc finger MYND domain-containing protein [Phanerochaete sordida]|uniref:Zinc finger MYND domain-containing protein n=1 Tax=Phanerochaete sordida TaxID=48140 RepID=A0A9P3GCL5_9APHY|nr:zinc finger MYND domain-containing protein [Phanerochaete sordida]